MCNGLERYHEKLEVIIAFANSVAALSTCKRLQVGAVIVDHGLTEILAFGYNGPASSVDNESCSAEPGQCGCVHAETNALLKLSDKTTPSYMISTYSPCAACAGLILNTPNITDVLCLKEYRGGNTMKFHMIGSHYEIIQRRKTMYDSRRSAMFGWREVPIS
jgi:dCMP deaminase